MAKPRSRWVCQECGAQSASWFGRCAECGAGGTLVEEVVAAPSARRAGAAPAGQGPVPIGQVLAEDPPRTATGMAELDRVLGGGLVPGGVVLIGGTPGIGKSTLVLQAAGAVAKAGRPVLYVSGEESRAQIAMRARRLGVAAPALHLLSETALEPILGHAETMRPALCIVDSIQTMHAEDLSGAPGTVGQVRECGGRLTAFAKASGVPLVLVGHVTKEGTLAGPRTLEHLVDVVLEFEGDRFQALRVLRAAKNRYGATDEVGVFEMTGEGLQEVANPSARFCSGEARGPNTVAVATIQGSRPLLVEVQALATRSALAVPLRRATGPDPNRLHMLCAVLREHGRLPLGKQDVFVSVAGGLRVEEPAADLGIALAIGASIRRTGFPADTVVLGEVGLGGEVRPVPFLAQRLREAARMGLRRALVPATKGSGADGHGLDVQPVRTLGEALEGLGGSGG